MSPTWHDENYPKAEKPGIIGWMFLILRAPIVLIVVFGGLLLSLLVRLIERRIYGLQRPITPWITQAVCRGTLRVLGLRVKVRGPRMKGAGAIVANHSSWLDIFVLNSRKNIYFVSKAEVAKWPGIGWLARATGTMFINRDRREAKVQTQIMEDRLMQGHRLLFFPEGTSTDGQRVLPFKTTLFAAFFSDRLKHELQLQSVSVLYHAPNGEDPRFYGWWGDMDFAPSLLKFLAQAKQGHVELVYHDPVRVDDFANRKSLAAFMEAQVKQDFDRFLAEG